MSILTFYAIAALMLIGIPGIAIGMTLRRWRRAGSEGLGFLILIAVWLMAGFWVTGWLWSLPMGHPGPRMFIPLVGLTWGLVQMWFVWAIPSPKP